MTEQDRKEFEAWWFPYASRNQPSLGMAAHAAWLAARRTQDEKVRELVEFVDEAGHYSWCRHVIHPTQDCSCPHTLAAQLREQDDA